MQLATVASSSTYLASQRTLKTPVQLEHCVSCDFIDEMAERM